MNKKLVIFLWLVAISLISVTVITIYLFNKPHRNIAQEEADFTISANELVLEFLSDENASNAKYLDKVISFEGLIIEKGYSSGDVSFVFVDEFEGVTAIFDSLYVENNSTRLSAFEVGDNIKLKGKCDGFLMLQGVVMNKCVIE